MKRLLDIYRGYFWPYLALMGGVSFGVADESHSHWHWIAWPAFAIGLFATLRAQSIIKGAER